MPKSVPALQSAPTPLAPYSVVTEANGFVFVSGQVAVDPAGGPTPVGAGDQTRLILENLGRILGDLGLGYADVVKTTVFLADMAEYGAVNDVYGSFFPSAPPARSAVEVAALPRPELRVEIEAVVAR